MQALIGAAVGSFVLLVVLLVMGLVTEPLLNEALAISDGPERPLLVLLDFVINNPFGLLQTWRTGTTALFTAAFKAGG